MTVKKSPKEIAKIKANIVKAYADLAKKLKYRITGAIFEKNTEYTADRVRHLYGKLSDLEKEAKQKYPNAFKNFNEKTHSIVVKHNEDRDSLLQEYADLSKEHKRHITLREFSDHTKHSKSFIRDIFESFPLLEKAAREAYPDSFYDIKIKDIDSPKKIKELQKVVKDHKRFIITTAVTGCQADIDFLKSIENYCNKQDAAFLVLVASDPSHVHMKGGGYGSVDTNIVEHGGHIVLEDTSLNNNIYISTLKISAKHIDPITGLGRIGQKNGSFIYASPKQRLKAIPTSNIELPNMLMTTGAVTIPDYKTDHYMSERTSVIANNDHVMGGIIVEIQDKNIYHFRQIQCDKDGSFIDLGVQYNADGTTEKVAPEAFILGDWHSGSTDEVAKRSWIEIAKQLKVKSLILHDLYDGMAISHHEQDQGILKAQRAQANQLDLGAELKSVARDLDELSALVEKIIVVKSNHDVFLERYLQDGRYVRDPQNHKISLYLALAMIDNKDPLQYGVEMQGLKNKDKITWLKIDDDYKIAGIQLGAHGHKGPNGSRGSTKGMETAYGSSVTGHSHTPEVLRSSWVVGTSSHLKLTYNQGSSSWLHTSCLLYKNGMRQLINVIGGNWKLKD